MHIALTRSPLLVKHRAKRLHHLNLREVADSSAYDPVVAERVSHAPRPVATELIGEWVDLLGTGLESSREDRMRSFNRALARRGDLML